MELNPLYETNWQTQRKALEEPQTTEPSKQKLYLRTKSKCNKLVAA